MNELEKVKKEKYGLDSKLTGFESTSSPPKKDMSWTGLPEFADDTITDYSRPSPSLESNTSDLQNNNSSFSKHGESSSCIMSKPMIKFEKASDSPTVIKTNKTETARKPPVKYTEMYRNTSKSPKVRGNQRNWNNLKSQQLGKDFLMKNKACFKCGHFDHMAYDCGVWVEKGKNWSKNNFAHKNVKPRANLLKTGRTPIAVNRTNMNVAQPKRTSFAKTTHSYGNSQNNIDDKGYWDSGFPRHMTGNISYLSEYEPYDGGYVSFGQGGGKITSKGKQHKASCKTKLVKSVSKPLHTLHMDLLGPTSISSLNHRVLGGCWKVVGEVIGSRGKWWSGAEMGESGVAGCGRNLG
nr:ribonuclease H-like domain-containing protein [Tanacetum cinerariifolium]